MTSQPRVLAQPLGSTDHTLSDLEGWAFSASSAPDQNGPQAQAEDAGGAGGLNKTDPSENGSGGRIPPDVSRNANQCGKALPTFLKRYRDPVAANNSRPPATPVYAPDAGMRAPHLVSFRGRISRPVGSVESTDSWSILIPGGIGLPSISISNSPHCKSESSFSVNDGSPNK